jgi:hypothetical protein
MRPTAARLAELRKYSENFTTDIVVAELLAEIDALTAERDELREALKESTCRCRHEWDRTYHCGREIQTMGKLIEECSRCAALARVGRGTE